MSLVYRWSKIQALAIKKIFDCFLIYVFGLPYLQPKVVEYCFFIIDVADIFPTNNKVEKFVDFIFNR